MAWSPSALAVFLSALLMAAPLVGPASAQTPCSFVSGFAQLAAMLGPERVGQCTGDQEPTPIGALQWTTNGAFIWRRAGNLTAFSGGDGVWILGPYGLQRRDPDEYFEWEVAGGQQPLVTVQGQPSVPVGSKQPAAPPAPRQRSQNELAADCAGLSAAELMGGLYASPAERQRHEAEFQAINYLCGEAIRKDGEKGLGCFQEAYDAAKALARVMPGSARAATAYDDAYAACIGR